MSFEKKKFLFTSWENLSSDAVRQIKKETLNNLKNTYCRLKPSKIEGVGVFAIRDIPKGKNPFSDIKNSRYQKFNMQELKKLDKEILKMIDDFFVIEDDNTVNITENALNGMNISFFLNHSSAPNLKIYDDGKNDSYCFKTIHKIKKGEELTIAYQDYDENYKQRFK